MLAVQHAPKPDPGRRLAAAPRTQVERRMWQVPASVVHRAPSCACGGSCPRCKAQSDHPSSLRLSQPGDAREREADAIAARVTSGDSGPILTGGARGGVPRAARENATPSSPAGLAGGLRSPSQPLDAPTRTFMESRFGHDFGHVRIHTGHEAAETASQIAARAYTVGGHIVFGADEYTPGSSAGRRLLAHELVHVLQQAAGEPGSLPSDVVQRAPTISVLPEGFIGPPSPSQRRAEQSCPITCCEQTLGTLHAMPLFHHQSRGAQVAAGSAAATGIGAALHFIADGTQPAASDVCHCDDFRIIQVLETTDPAPGRGGNSYVDNSGRNTPFYSDVFRGGRGEHAIPAGYPDAGERIETTESIYDRPYRDPGTLGTTSLSWMAESCVACIKNSAPDRVLGCVTYGFTRHYNASTHGFDPVVAVAPGCRSRASAHFVNTLSSDPTTTSYDFKTAPASFAECGRLGDFPLPQGETRLA